jgi:hypothetical protein
MLKNFFRHHIRMLQCVIIPKPKDFNSQLPEPGRAFSIVGRNIRLAMLTPIKFHCKAARIAIKVEDIFAYRMLSAKLETLELPTTQNRPDFLLGIGRQFSHLAGKTDEPTLFITGSLHSLQPSIPRPSP